MHKSIILMGIKHCGKSTLGKLVAQQLSCNFYDTDNLIYELTGKTAREIYKESGSDAFIFSETAACKFLTEKFSASKFKFSKTIPAVIATGGGICNNGEAIDLLHNIGIFVFLDIWEEIAADRIISEIVYKNGKMTNIPAYISQKEPKTEDDVRKIFSDFYKERTILYKNIADVTWTPENASEKENSKKLVAALEAAGAIPSHPAT